MMTQAAVESTWIGSVVAANDHPRNATRFPDGVWSGRELLDRAGGAADWLDALGLVPEKPVPALVSTSAAALALVVGGSGSGHPIAPLGVRMTPHELAAIVTALDAGVLVAQPGHAGTAQQVAELTGCRVAVLPDLAASPRDLRAEPEATAAVLHTSGTTGTPKAIAMAQWRLAARIRVNGPLLELDAEGLYGASAPFHHIMGFGNIATSLAVGARLTGVERFSVEGWGVLRDAGVTHTSVVPAMLEMLLASGQARLPGLRVLHYGGSPIRVRTLRATYETMPGVRMVNAFGQTEGSPISALTPDDHRLAVEKRPDLLLSVGRALDGVDLRITDPDPDGVGEVLARADHMYRVDEQGWLHTGDLGRIDDDGYLYLSGRRNDLIIRGGENVHPLEVETVLAAHPHLTDVAVVGVPDDRLGQTVVAFVVPASPDTPPTPDQLHTYARTRLSGFKVPTRWHIVPDLPRNTNGKVLRRNLQEPDA